MEKFTDVFHSNFAKVQDARKAKKFLDAREFYGGILHISYAPELETIDELRAKLDLRETEVRNRIKANYVPDSKDCSNKRKTIDELIDNYSIINKKAKSS